MAKKVTANGKTFTFDDNVSNDQIGSVIDEYFSSLKKKSRYERWREYLSEWSAYITEWWHNRPKFPSKWE